MGKDTKRSARPAADTGRGEDAPPNVMLPPIHATPEEIAQALVRTPPLKRRGAEDSGDS